MTGDATVCRDTSEALTGALESLIGVNRAVNAISLFTRGVADTAGDGNCGVAVTVSVGPSGVCEDGATGSAIGIADICMGSTIAVSTGRSATLRNCLRASVAAGMATVGIADELIDPNDGLVNIDWIAESTICSDGAIANCVRPSATTGSPTACAEGGEGTVDAEDNSPHIDSIIDSAIGAGDAVVLCVCASALTGNPTVGAELRVGAVDSDNKLLNIDRIIAAATCAGDPVVAGVLAGVAKWDVA
jgi:hypothetical protein